MKIAHKSRRSSEDHWIPLSDLMTGLMMLFLLVAIIFMVQLKAKEKQVANIGKGYVDLKSELCGTLRANFKGERDVDIDPGCSLAIRFSNSDNQFDTGKSEVKPSFQDKLKAFFPKYISILTSAKFRDFVDEVRIEGHTSSLWGNPPIPGEQAYYKNMALSQDRSRSVLEYVLSVPAIRTSENLNWLIPRLTANGLSSVNPIKIDGTVSEKLSQRVEFRIRTRSEARLDEMLKALSQ